MPECGTPDVPKGRAPTPVAGGFSRGDVRLLAGGFLLFFLSSFGQTFFISLFSDDIRTEYGLSHGTFGGLYTAATLVGAFTLVRAGHLVDHRPARAVVRVTVPPLALGAVAMAVSPHVAVLFTALVLLRFFGQGMMTHASFTLMGRWFTRERGRAVSVATLGLNTGEALLPLLAVAVAAGVGWRSAWWGAAAVLAVAGFLLPLLFARERRPSGGTEGAAVTATTAPTWTRAEALRDPYFYLLMPAVAAPALIGNTVFFHLEYLVELRHWSPEASGSAFAVYAVATVVCNLVGGHMLDRLTALGMMPYFLLPLGCGLLVLSTADGQWSVFAFMALYGVTNGLSLSLFGATWPEVYGVGHLGAIRAVVVAVVVCAAAVGPGMSGLLIDGGVSYPGQIAAMGVHCLAASALMLRVTRRLRTRRRTPRTPLPQ
ncbi:MFS transporter [Streptomyces sp. 891-h]|uniref:MFS transporter n=1 Tax=Streptomyces sp. 891-h TaxID=2720714 RepID=UPI001FAA65BE|nr:MFS transporter [Streptomyces sp. 891-h]